MKHLVQVPLINDRYTYADGKIPGMYVRSAKSFTGLLYSSGLLEKGY